MVYHVVIKGKGVQDMYTRCFERTNAQGQYEVVNISDYGFEWYVDNKMVRVGLVEDVESDIESLLDIGFEEVV